MVLVPFVDVKVPHWLLTRLDDWSRTWLTSKIDEVGVHVCKTRSNASDLGTMGRPFRWAALIEPDGIKSYGLLPLAIASADHAAALGNRFDHTSNRLFEAEQDVHSVDVEHLSPS